MQVNHRRSTTWQCRAFSAIFASLLGGVALPALAADQILLKLTGIVGDSAVDRHKGEIDLTAYSQAFRNTANFGFGAGGGAGRAACGDISVLKNIDRSSPDLIMHVVTGRHITDGLITFRRTTADGPQEFYTVRLTDVIVDAIEQADPAGEPGLSEKVSLKARQFRFTYRAQLPDGRLGPEQSFGWDCVSNTRL